MNVVAPTVLAALMHPALFYAGAAAVGLPILIHLLARRRFQRIRWAAMDFLVDAERRNRRRIRMEEWILLALRCLAMLLIGLLIARPFIQPEGVAAALGGRDRTERVFVIDDSFSMGYRSGDESSFDRAKIAVRTLIETIRTQTPDDTVTILRTSDPSDPLESGTYLDDVQTQELLARLEGLRCSQEAMEPASVTAGLVEVLERTPSILSAVVYVISDFQRHDWVDRDTSASRNGKETASGLSGEPGSSGIMAPLAVWAEADRGLRLFLIDIGDDEAGNMAVTQVTFGDRVLVAGTSGNVQATVANFADEPVSNVKVGLTVGDSNESSKTLGELAPGQIATLNAEMMTARAGDEWVRVELQNDPLPLDDVRYAAAPVSNAIRVLVVNGEPSADDYDDETSLLMTALRPEGEVFSGNEPAVVDETELEETRLSEFHVVLLANVYRLSEPAVERLERFVHDGGGVVFFLGDQVDPDFYNSSLYREGEGLLPAALLEASSAPGGARLVVEDRLHPVMRALIREGDPLGIGQVDFFRFFTAQAAHNEEKAYDTTQQSGDIAGVPSATRVLAVFETDTSHPAVIERRFGAGRVILFTSSVDKEWNNWADHPTYLPVLMELVGHVARQSKGAGDVLVGAPIELRIDPAKVEPDALLRLPSYPAQREVSLSATAGTDGRGMVFRWEETHTSGLYRFALRQRDGSETIQIIAVNPDPRESDLTPANEEELRRTMPEIPFEYVDSLDQLTSRDRESRTELWAIFLIAALATLMTEQGLAWWWGRRR
jgi:hypothetical protein